jgi:hypothetical protein
VQCIRSKHAQFGIKIYKVCDSNTGYCHSFKIYTGEDIVYPSLPASTNVVLAMCEPLFNKGHTLFLDNWHMSPDLCKRVTEQGTNIVGTVRPNGWSTDRSVSLIVLTLCKIITRFTFMSSLYDSQLVLLRFLKVI